MIIDNAKLREFEQNEVLRKDITFADALVIFENLRKEAVSLGAICSDNILEGLEADIRLARAINGLHS